MGIIAMQNEKCFEQFLVLKGLMPITVSGYVGSYKRMSSIIGEYPTKEEAQKYIYQL